MNFIAMDFETASAKRYSAVSLGLAVVRDNKLVDEFYTLITLYHSILQETYTFSSNINNIDSDQKSSGLLI